MKSIQFNTMGARSVLSAILIHLSRWAVRKHDMRLVVIAGRHGTKLTGELIGDMLSPDYVVRRQLEKPFWDFSVPLSILGFEDRQYSGIEWGGVILRSIFRLIFGRPNKTWTILQMNTYKEDIARFWSEMIEPEILVLVNAGTKLRRLEKLLVRRTRRFVVITDDLISQVKNIGAKKAKVITVGEKKGSDFRITDYQESENGTEISGVWAGKKDVMKMFAFQKGDFMKHPLELSIAVLLALDFSKEEVSEKVLQSQIELERFIFAAPKTV